MTGESIERRHRTAIVRGTLSRPVRLAVDLGVIGPDSTFFDYGCGYGEDVAGLSAAGLVAAGWDPHFRPDERRAPADIVNLGYVVNVIPDAIERQQVVLEAFRLARKALIVSARLENELRGLTAGRPVGDGFLTGNNTFQRFYDQSELRAWLDGVLELETIAIAPGIFIAFKVEEDANAFLMQRRRRRAFAVRVSRSDRIYDEHREVIDQLIEFYAERGRLPAKAEAIDLQNALAEGVGSVRRAWTVARAVTPDTDWEDVTEVRRMDLLSDLALLKLNRRPTFSALPEGVQNDVRGLVGSYKQAVADADRLLLSAGDLETVSDAADRSPIGKRLPTSLYVHESALEDLPHVLRVYEGCARWLVGEVDGANLVKLATDKPKVSYLEYPGFDTDPHPALHRTTFVRIGALSVDVRDYGGSDNPPILHRKETFVADDYPLRSKFARLTAQEERFGLLSGDTRSIGNARGWEEHLEAHRVSLRGHRVVRRAEASGSTRD
jgi:DNA phosphorothioation-associated putative methyltransferase